MLPFNDDAGYEATDGVSNHSRDQMSASVSHRGPCCDLEVQGNGEHHLDTMLAFNCQLVHQERAMEGCTPV